jgi:hypothetical protein
MERRLSAIILAQEYARQQQNTYYSVEVLYDKGTAAIVVYSRGRTEISRVLVDGSFTLQIIKYIKPSDDYDHPRVIEFTKKYDPWYDPNSLTHRISLIPNDLRRGAIVDISFVEPDYITETYDCGSHNREIPVTALCDVIDDIVSVLGLPVVCKGLFSD